jgi:uncharacterized protein (DUF362 family)/Pyruvate/2-oxoacid:ferredoxin oxidoreductase delta subunit
MVLQDLGKEVWLGDSPGGSVPVERIFETTGIKELCSRYKVRLINFNTQPIKNLQIEGREYNIVQTVFDADAVIDLAKYKTHSLMYYTGCIKNLYGLIPGLKKSDYHSRYPTYEAFSQVIADIYQLAACRICLNIMDGIVGMEGEGPSAGQPRNFGIMMASLSGAALDWQAAHMMGFKDEQLGYITSCLAFDQIEPGDIKIESPWQKHHFPAVKIKKVSQLIKILQHSPRFLQNIFRRYFNFYPAFNNRCRLCGVCRDSCPVQAITISPNDKTPRIDHDKCIKCMCCHELCPYQAVYIYKSLLARFIVK